MATNVPGMHEMGPFFNFLLTPIHVGLVGAHLQCTRPQLNLECSQISRYTTLVKYWYTLAFNITPLPPPPQLGRQFYP